MKKPVKKSAPKKAVKKAVKKASKKIVKYKIITHGTNEVAGERLVIKGHPCIFHTDGAQGFKVSHGSTGFCISYGPSKAAAIHKAKQNLSTPTAEAVIHVAKVMLYQMGFVVPLNK